MRVIDSCISQLPVLDWFDFSRVLHDSIILYKSRRRHAKHRRDAAALNSLKEDTEDLFQYDCASPSNAIASEPLWNGQTRWREREPSFFEYEPQLEPLEEEEEKEEERPDDSAKERLRVQLPQDCLQCLPNLEKLPSNPYLPDDDAAETQFAVSVTSQNTFHDTAKKPSEGEDKGGEHSAWPQQRMAREFSSSPRSSLFSPISEPEQDIAASLYCTWPAARDIEARDIEARDIEAQDVDAQDVGCTRQRKSFLLIPAPMPPPLSPVMEPMALNSIGSIEIGNIENTPNYTADNSDDEMVEDRMQNSYEGEESGMAMRIQSLEVAETAVNEQSLPGKRKSQDCDEVVAENCMVPLPKEEEEASTEAAKEQAEEDEKMEEESEEKRVLVLHDPASNTLVRGGGGDKGGDSCAGGADRGLDNQGGDKHDGEGEVDDLLNSRVELDASLHETGKTTRATRNKGPNMRTSFARAKVYTVARTLTHTHTQDTLIHARTCTHTHTHTHTRARAQVHTHSLVRAHARTQTQCSNIALKRRIE
jgi:hypothetical protein